jgi:hypothetical protein
MMENKRILALALTITAVFMAVKQVPARGKRTRDALNKPLDTFN